MNDKILPTHLARPAAVYLRQSTLEQVHEHRESTARQYALRERALALGWPPDSPELQAFLRQWRAIQHARRRS